MDGPPKRLFGSSRGTTSLGGKKGRKWEIKEKETGMKGRA